MIVVGSRRTLGRRAARGGGDAGCLGTTVTRRRDGTSGRGGRGLVVRGLLGTPTLQNVGPPDGDVVGDFVGCK